MTIFAVQLLVACIVSAGARQLVGALITLAVGCILLLVSCGIS